MTNLLVSNFLQIIRSEKNKDVKPNQRVIFNPSGGTDEEGLLTLSDLAETNEINIKDYPTAGELYDYINSSSVPRWRCVPVRGVSRNVKLKKSQLTNRPVVAVDSTDNVVNIFTFENDYELIPENSQNTEIVSAIVATIDIRKEISVQLVRQGTNIGATGDVSWNIVSNNYGTGGENIFTTEFESYWDTDSISDGLETTVSGVDELSKAFQLDCAVLKNIKIKSVTNTSSYPVKIKARLF